MVIPTSHYQKNRTAERSCRRVSGRRKIPAAGLYSSRQVAAGKSLALIKTNAQDTFDFWHCLRIVTKTWPLERMHAPSGIKMASTSEAGASGVKEKRSRKRKRGGILGFTSPSSSTPAIISQAPRAINAAEFAEARALEISNMVEAIKEADGLSGKRLFQTLPKHMRRRAMSHNIKRIPSRLRQRASFEVKNEFIMLAKNGTWCVWECALVHWDVPLSTPKHYPPPLKDGWNWNPRFFVGACWKWKSEGRVNFMLTLLEEKVSTFWQVVCGVWGKGSGGREGEIAG